MLMDPIMSGAIERHKVVHIEARAAAPYGPTVMQVQTAAVDMTGDGITLAAPAIAPERLLLDVTEDYVLLDAPGRYRAQAARGSQGRAPSPQSFRWF